jgi:hypothetical protein
MSTEKDNNELLKELLSKQIKTVPQDKKLQYTDLKRICKYVTSSIFEENKCCLWNGYITNINNSNKGTYINFYFRNKKVALHRLLYINFVDELRDDEYLKFSCEHKGRCCNIYHLKKFQYQKLDPETVQTKVNNTNTTQNKEANQPEKNQVLIISKISCENTDKLRIHFD